MTILHITPTDLADYTTVTAPGWYCRDGGAYIGPFATRAAAQDEAIELEAHEAAEQRAEDRHSRSLQYPGAP